MIQVQPAKVSDPVRVFEGSDMDVGTRMDAGMGGPWRGAGYGKSSYV